MSQQMSNQSEEALNLISKYKTKDILRMSSRISSIQHELYEPFRPNPSANQSVIEMIRTTTAANPSALSFLCKISILNGNDHRRIKIFDRDNVLFQYYWNLFTPLLNAVIDIDDASTKISQYGLLGLLPLVSDQLPFQEPFKNQAARFYALIEMIPNRMSGLTYSPSKRFMDITGLSISEFMTIGFAFIIKTIESNGIIRLDKNLIDDCETITEEKVNLFLKQTKADYKQFRDISECQSKESKLERYAFNPLCRKPIIECQDGDLVIPVVQMLQLKITWGIYYILLDADPNVFPRNFGLIFEKYVGILLEEMTGTTNLLAEQTIRQKSEFRGPADWMWLVEKDLVLVESKKSMLTLNAKTLKNSEDIESNIRNTIGDAAKQLRKNIMRLKEGIFQIPNYNRDNSKIFPLSITLGDFYFDDSKILLDFIKEDYEGLENISEGFLSLSIETLEIICQNYNRDEFIELLKYKLNDPSIRQEHFHATVVNHKNTINNVKRLPQFLEEAYKQFTKCIEK